MIAPLTTRNQHQTRDMIARPLSLRAETINTEERSVEAVLSSGGRVQVFDFRSFRIIDEILVPSGAQFGKQVPLLESHQRFSTEGVIGSVRDIRVEGDKVIGRLVFAKDDERADRAWKLVEQGHLTDVSIGYRATDFVDIEPNASLEVDGRKFQAGERKLRITRKYQLREGSIVPIGADDAAKLRSDHDVSTQGSVTMKKELRTYLESLGLRADAGDPEAWDFLHNLPKEQQTRGLAIHEGREPEGQRSAGQRSEPTSPPSEGQSATAQTAATLNPDQIRADVLQAERDRVALCHSERCEGVDDELVQRAISEGWDEHQIRREYLSALRNSQSSRPVSGAPAGHVRDHERDCETNALAGALMMRMSIDPEPLCRTDQHRRSWEEWMNRGERYQHMSLIDHCREACRIHGAVDPETGSQPYTRDGFIRAAVSTPTLTNAFTTSVNARLLQAYMDAPDSTEFVEVVDVADFKTNEVIALGKGSDLEILPRGNTAKHSTFADSQETYRIYRYARQFAVDEQDIIDDNLDAFQSVAPELGMAAAQVRPDLVYYLLMSNPTLAADSTAVFAAGHNNDDTNTFSAENLKTGIAAMQNQTQDGRNLNIVPEYIIVGPTLAWLAMELMNSTQITIGDTSEIRGMANVLNGRMSVISDSRVENGVTDPVSGSTAAGSTTEWILASRPFRTVRVAYLAGSGRRPMLRRFTLDRGQWGVGWDIKLDVGAAILDYRGLYRGNV